MIFQGGGGGGGSSESAHAMCPFAGSSQEVVSIVLYNHMHIIVLKLSVVLTEDLYV